MGYHNYKLARVLLTLFCTILVGGLHAKTQPDDSRIFARDLGEAILADIVEQDTLVYECIPKEKIDAAFFASGKGLRLPQNCLPEPCIAALSRVQLAALVGLMPYEWEWDDYYRRYADVCRKEMTAFGTETLGDETSSGPVRILAFWAPILPTGSPRAAQLKPISRILTTANLPIVVAPTLQTQPSSESPGPRDRPVEPSAISLSHPPKVEAIIEQNPTPVLLTSSLALIAIALSSLCALKSRSAAKS